MPRALFGGSASDFVYQTAAGGAIRAAAATLTLWDAEVGGNQVTDLVLNSVAVSVIPVGPDGQVPDFEGPDDWYSDLWASANGGPRIRLTPAGGVLTQAEASASFAPRVTRTKHAPAFGLYFPEAEGAVGDLVADDTAAFQAAVNAMPARGGKLYVDGTFKTTGAVTATNPLVIVGSHMSRSKVIQYGVGAGKHGFTSTTASITAIDVEISTSAPLAANNAQKAINVQPAAGAGISATAIRVKSRGFNFGVYASGAADGSSPLDSIHVEQCDIQISATAASVAEPISAHRAVRTVIHNNTLDGANVGDHGIYAIGNKSLSITKNRITNINTFAVKAITEAVDTTTDFGIWDIFDNVIVGCSAAVSVQLQGANHRLGLLRVVNDIRTVTDAVGGAGAGVLVTASHATSRFDLVIFGGRMYDTQKAGFLCQGVAGSVYKSVVVGPLFVGKFGQATTSYAVTFGSGTTIESVSVPHLEVDGEGVGRAALNLGFAARANVGHLYERNCTHTSNALKVGFFGATPVTKPTALTAAAAAAPAGGTGTAAGGWDTAANRDTAIATINNLRTRLNELETKLRDLGLLT